MKTKRTFNTEEKLSILGEGSENGVQPTLEKHGIYPATFYRANDDGWFALTANYVYRTGYETTFETAEKWELGAEFEIPNFDTLKWGLEYEFGRDFKSLQEIDAVTIELEMSY